MESLESDELRVSCVLAEVSEVGRRLVVSTDGDAVTVNPRIDFDGRSPNGLGVYIAKNLVGLGQGFETLGDVAKTRYASAVDFAELMLRNSREFTRGKAQMNAESKRQKSACRAAQSVGNMTKFWCLGSFFLVFSCGLESTSPEIQTATVVEPLKLDEAAVYRVAEGETLSQIAQGCKVPGGATTLAGWNQLADLDQVEADYALLVPPDAACGRELPLARLPRFSANSKSCQLDWASLRPEGQGDTEDAKRHCAAPGDGFKVCWQAWKSPGLEIHRDRKLVHRDDEPLGDGGASGGVPQVSWKDLDGNGTRELIVTQLAGWSNGISIPRTQILIFDEEQVEPTVFRSAFYHREHWLENDRRGCDFLEIEMRRLTGPILGEGNYFVGVRRQWSQQELRPVGPSFASKRLVHRFFAEYRDAVWGGDSAHGWLLDGQAEARPIAELGD